MKRECSFYSLKNKSENDTKNLRLQLSQKEDEIERLTHRILELELEASQVGSLRIQIEELTNRTQMKELNSREKEESIIKAESDLRNLERVEATLKAEIEDLLEKRRALEDINQNLKNQICECNIALRQMASQLDSVKRENIALTSNIEIFRRSEEQLRHENSNLKELVNNIEIERIHYRATSELMQRELSYAKKENANFMANDNRNMNFAQPLPELQRYSSQMNDLGIYPQDQLATYQDLFPSSEISGANSPGKMPLRTGASMEELYQVPNTVQSMYNNQGTTPKTQDPPLDENLKSQVDFHKNSGKPDLQSTPPVSIFFDNLFIILETKTSNAFALKHPI